MKTNLILIISVFLILILSCSDSDDKNDCIENRVAFVTSVNSPSTGAVNEIITIEVNFGVSNGCGQFGKFIQTENGNTKTIEVEAKYVGCVCTQDAPIRTANYQFKAQNSGNYELKFKSSETDFITINLTIN